MSNSDSDEDNCIRYGTALEPYEEDEIPSKRKFQQPSDQYAVDAHGRRRFHGAFTGGFSAGFGNTVGSQEGWTPSTFKSSRAEKAERTMQRPEDFMDDEDRGEHGIAPRQMQTQNDFTGQKRQMQRYHDGPIPGEPVLEQLIRAVHETAAVKMLKAMGWREGQGIGDRVTRKQKKEAKDLHKVYGCYVPPELRQTTEEQSDSDSEFEYETLFAPDDYEPYILGRKNDRFGLGYSGLSRHSVLGDLVGEYGEKSGKSHLVMKDKGKKVSIRGQAFGVGAFETEDADIYATEDMSHYDFALGGPSKEKEKSRKERGVNVLEGFVKSTKPLPSVPSYPPPAIPRDYIPLAAGARKSRFEPTTRGHRDQGLGRHDLTAEARGTLLGEPTIDKQNDTIDKTITKPTTTNVTNTKILDLTKPIVNEDYISIKESNNDLKKVFKPFIGDPKKQARYERYLKDKDIVTSECSSMDRVTEWERHREMVEFEQAAKLYRPLTGEMGDRFTHASEPDENALNPLHAVAKSSTNYGLATRDQIDAAEKGLYGALTRTTIDWRPESLVYKRFNIPDPGGIRPEKKEDKQNVSYSIFSYMESSVHNKDSFAKEQNKFSGSKSVIDTKKVTPKTIDKVEPTESKRMTVAELFIKESEKDLKNNEIETIEKFDKMDLYKSIFLSDSEEETQKVTNKPTDFIDVPKNLERNTSPPRGIFANIDFDEINSWRRKTDKESVTDKKDETTDDKSKNTDKKKEINEATDKTNDIEADVYGPKIPEVLQKRLEVKDDFKPTYRNKEEREVDSSSSDSWVDAREVKLKKKKKKVKKHKSKHKKVKRKKEKH